MKLLKCFDLIINTCDNFRFMENKTKLDERMIEEKLKLKLESLKKDINILLNMTAKLKDKQEKLISKINSFKN